ncbi:MAG: sensor domain-containing diguanylate cyclase [Gemmatimonadota bacterium]|nr:sensor domain-containing diguanylate cyclase [Gemmatimonadota bacterium]
MARDTFLRTEVDEMASLKEALRNANAEVKRLRDEAAAKENLVEILHEVIGTLSSSELFHMLARRLAKALDLSHSSIVFAQRGDPIGTVASAFEDPQLENLEIELGKYPEIGAALEKKHPILIPDIWRCGRYAELREKWLRDGTKVSVRSVLALPFTFDGSRTGVFLLRRTAEKPSFNEADAEFAETVIRSAMTALHRAHTMELTKADNERLEALAHIDPLTQLLNRRALTVNLVVELERVRRYNAPLTVLMIDVDHFKLVNDTHGHIAGDLVLEEIGLVLQRAVRSVDTVARYGGEEFVVVLPETGEQGAMAFAERLRAKMEWNSFSIGKGQSLKLTISIGLTTFEGARAESAEELLDSADKALYRAKQGGRNKVSV